MNTSHKPIGPGSVDHGPIGPHPIGPGSIGSGPGGPGPLGPTASGTWQAALGAACTGAGLVLLVCRYWLLPIGGEGQIGTVVLGLGIGLVVVGSRIFRASKVRSRSAEILLAGVVGGGLAFGGAWLLLAPQALAEAPLQTASLPGLAIDLPPGPPAERQVDDAAGMMRYQTPWGRTGGLTLEWEVAAALTRTDMQAAFGALRDQIDPAAELRIDELPAGGPAGFRFHILADRMTLGGLRFQCPDDPRTFSLVLGLQAEAAEFDPLLARIESSVACGSPPAGMAAGPALPRVALADFGLVAGSVPPQLVSLDGEALLIHRNRHGDLQRQMRDNPQLIQALFRSMFAAADGDTTFHAPRPLVAGQGDGRKWWPVDVTMDGEQTQAAFSVLDCADRSSYLLFYFSPQETAPAGRPEQVLGAIRCPAAGQPPEAPPPIEQLARKACEHNDPRGCDFLSRQKPAETDVNPGD